MYSFGIFFKIFIKGNNRHSRNHASESINGQTKTDERITVGTQLKSDEIL